MVAPSFTYFYQVLPCVSGSVTSWRIQKNEEKQFMGASGFLMWTKLLPFSERFQDVFWMLFSAYVCSVAPWDKKKKKKRAPGGHALGDPYRGGNSIKLKGGEGRNSLDEG